MGRKIRRSILVQVYLLLKSQGGGGDLVVQGDVSVAKCCKPLAVVAFSLSASNFWLPYAPITIASLSQKQSCYCMTDMRKKTPSVSI